MDTTTAISNADLNRLRAALAEAEELADGEAVDACSLLLGAVGDFLSHVA